MPNRPPPVALVAAALAAIAAAAAVVVGWASTGAVPGDTAAVPRATSPGVPPWPKGTQVGVAAATPSVSGPAWAAAPINFQGALREFEWRLVSGDEQEREQALDLRLPALLAQNPDALRRAVEQMPAGPLHDRLRSAVIARWAVLDSAAAVGWVASMTDSEERTQAGREVVSALARSEPAHALEVAERLGVGLVDGSAVRTARLWAEADAPAALDWAVRRLSVPAGAAQELAMPIVQAAVQAWTRQDPAAAAAWIDALPAGAVKDHALQASALEGNAPAVP